MVRQLLERIFTAVAQVVTAVLYPYYLVRERQGWGGQIPILMYHQIGRPPGAARVSQDCVSPERFERQLRALLDSGYRVISLGQLLGLLNGPIEARRRCVALTFDDGLRGQFRHAYPILKRYGVPATFFLVAGYVGMKTVPPHLGLEPGQFGDRAQLAEWCPLSWEEAGELARNRMEIGSHSVSHRSLGCLGRETAINEVRWSKKLLEARLGVAVEFFAYPFGSHGYG
ncbi:MAG TPA: polysaccharide deacetylase family protein, partial [bacterium]|nr:polysaccharide deacetylase family protein [bacterium]